VYRVPRRPKIQRQLKDRELNQARLKPDPVDQINQEVLTQTYYNSGTSSQLHSEGAAHEDGRGIVEERRAESDGPDEPRHEVVDTTR